MSEHQERLEAILQLSQDVETKLVNLVGLYNQMGEYGQAQAIQEILTGYMGLKVSSSAKHRLKLIPLVDQARELTRKTISIPDDDVSVDWQP